MMRLCFYLMTTTILVGSNFIQCPYRESACKDNIECGESSMGRRAGYFCNEWPFYSGGFAECCDENEEYYTCTHAVYNRSTNMAFCDFWYMTQQSTHDELQLCDCKLNNGQYCISWICATVSNYDFLNSTKSDAFLRKLLLPNNIEIYGVHECGYFSDAPLLSAGHLIKQWCYKYDDFKTCYCVPQTPTDKDSNNGYCREWVCHKYLNNAKNDLSLNDDRNKEEYQKYGNISGDTHTVIKVNTSEIDMLELSTKISHEQYVCTKGSISDDTVVEKAECIAWNGNLKSNYKRFSVMECSTDNWNTAVTVGAEQFTEMLPFHSNISMTDLVDTYEYKWQCHEVGMDYRMNTKFWNFYLSTIIWSVCIGFIGLFLIFCYMRYKYITLSSFFCVQGWFFFIFGSIAAVHGGFASFFVYFCLQFIILGYILYLKCKNKGKQPYGSISQRYDFEPELSVDNREEDSNL